MNYVCQRLSVPPAEAYGVATFYAMFSVEERPKTVVHVCDDLACRDAGGRALGEELCADRGRRLRRRRVDVAPIALPRDVRAGAGGVRAASERHRRLDRGRRARIDAIVSGGAVPATPPDGAPQTLASGGRDRLRLLRRIGVGDPASLEDYRASGGYEALWSAIEIGPEAVVQAVTDAKLLGRGGAAFPTGVKWKAVADQAVTPHYVIANADESEPGTFKDRVLIEGDPFADRGAHDRRFRDRLGARVRLSPWGTPWLTSSYGTRSSGSGRGAPRG